MKQILWKVLFVGIFMLYIAIIDYFFDGWMKYVLIGLWFGFYPQNSKKKRVERDS